MRSVRTLVVLMTLVCLPMNAQVISGGGCTMEHFRLDYPPFGIRYQFLAFRCPETEWFVLFRNTDRGLQVGPAFLRRKPEEDAIGVLRAANIAENLTIYHNGKVRLNDTEFSTIADAIPTLNESELGPAGMLITPLDENRPTVAAELRSRGLAWLCTWGKLEAKAVSRRGMEMTIWGIYDTGNYDYITEYTFRDDGQISFRVGATGWNNANPNHVTPDAPHTHTFLWRVDITLGSGLNTAQMWTHHESDLRADDVETLFNDGTEGAMDLDPLRFATVLIEDQMTNAHGRNLGYELQPMRVGTGRHYAANERWTLHDIYVTRYSDAEIPATFGFIPGESRPDSYLLGTQANQFGIYNHESVQNQDLVLWHTTSAHHQPHDEDQAAGEPGFKGITLIHWTGFDLVPHNLFDANPLGGPHRKTCDGYP